MPKLKGATAEYATDLIEEANRIETGRNSAGGTPEVTRGMVNDAKVLLRRGLGVPKKSMGVKILRVIAAVLSLAVGIMYDETKLQSGGYMALFVLVVAAAILTVTISTIKE
ncbi:MAG: hypothetical protein ACSHYF_18115 [Verrucomicrobiaceae bacterium]